VYLSLTYPDVDDSKEWILENLSREEDAFSGSSEDNLNLVCPPRSEDYDGDDIEAQLLQLPVLGSSEDKLSLVCLPPSDVDDLDDDVAEAQILPSPVQAWPEDRLFLRRSPRCKDEEDDDDDLDAHITAQKENDLTLESLSDEEIPPVETRSKDGPFLRCSPRCKDEEDDDDDLDAHVRPPFFLSSTAMLLS
uniref:Uncharacterized protein n=1 Tax=Pongo abelii TaxID=9601 RepID=A0A8I5T128_PONAB